MTDTPTLDRRYWRERAAEILPSATAREIVRAAHILRLQYMAPEAVYDVNGSTLPDWKRATVDVRAFDGRTGGGVPDMPIAPSPWEGRKHDLHLAAGKYHGRRGVARVQGGTVPTRLHDTVPSFMVDVLEDLPRTMIGANTYDVLAVTETFYGERLGVPRMIGTDAIAPAEIVRVADGVDPWSARFEHGVQDAVYRPQTWSTRTRLPRVTVRKSEAALIGTWTQAQAFNLTDCQAFWRDLHTAGPWTVTELPAPHTDRSRIWFGHRCLKRGVLAHKTRGGKRAARTIGTVHVDTAADAVARVENMNRGERVVLIVNGVRLTVSRGKGKSGVYSITAPGMKTHGGIRTAAGIATHVRNATT